MPLPQEIICRYPRLSASLLAIASETDFHWAAQIIESAKANRSGLSHGLVQEAYRKRRIYAGDPDAVSIVNHVLNHAFPKSLF